MKKIKCSELFKHKYLIEQLNDEFLAEQFMYYLYIVYSPKDGTMRNEIKFGILIVAIAAVGVGTLTTVLDNIVQDADAVPDTAGPHKKVPGQFPPGQTQGGQQGPPPPGQRGN